MNVRAIERKDRKVKEVLIATWGGHICYPSGKCEDGRSVAELMRVGNTFHQEEFSIQDWIETLEKFWLVHRELGFHKLKIKTKGGTPEIFGLRIETDEEAEQRMVRKEKREKTKGLKLAVAKTRFKQLKAKKRLSYAEKRELAELKLNYNL